MDSGLQEARRACGGPRGFAVTVPRQGPRHKAWALPSQPPGIQAAGPCSLPHRFILVPWTCLPQVVVLNGCASSLFLATVLCGGCG